MQSSSKFESCGEDSRFRTSELHVSNAHKGAVRASELNQSRETALPIEVADAEEILKERDACGVRLVNCGSWADILKCLLLIIARGFS